MKELTLLWVLLISFCQAQQQDKTIVQRAPRAPQGHLQYSDPDGSRVDWRIYVPFAQPKPNVSQRTARAESETAQARLINQRTDRLDDVVEKRAVQPVKKIEGIQVEYKPFSMIPNPIKELLVQMYETQEPYIDPSVYVYPAQIQQQQQKQDEDKTQSSSSERDETIQENSQSRFSSTGYYDYTPKPRYQYKYGTTKKSIYSKYKNNESELPRYGTIPLGNEDYNYNNNNDDENDKKQQVGHNDDGMPKGIHQLLTLQAQTPYHVIANRIVYKPKSIFVPKPFKEDIKGPYKYRSKVYYYKNNGYELEKKKKDETDGRKGDEDRDDDDYEPRVERFEEE